MKPTRAPRTRFGRAGALRIGGRLSASQVDKLGDRLRHGPLQAADLRLLDAYRVSHRVAYDTVVGTIRANLVLEPTGRPGKSTGAIVSKLTRQKTRLSQMQDIAGCRILVSDPPTQDRTVDDLLHLFQDAQVFDRRDRPSYGYRAVHLVVTWRGRSVEIQVRTRLQHLWAELSEKLADHLGNEVKYGGGPQPIRELLERLSQLVAGAETTMAEDGKFHAALHDVLLSFGQAAEELAKAAKESR